jgi:phosphatidylserine/phosphatidylglycerophosphate/cardiolipin synthase-like enzyme
MRIQQRVHNKGIVVDSRAVLVSSQNWSAEGVLQNRDAGLIIHNAAIAQYFEAIFLQDWEERATTRIASAPVAPIAHPSTSPKRRKATSR